MGDTSHIRDERPLLAFIYDRRFSPSVVLDLRLTHCREYAAAAGVEVAGVWIDTGDDALSDERRPLFADMVAAMRTAGQQGRTVACLVADWDRISRDAYRSAALRRMVAEAGGYTMTCDGDDDRAPVARTGAR